MPLAEDYFLLTERVFYLPQAVEETTDEIKARTGFLEKLYRQKIVTACNTKRTDDPCIMQFEILFAKFKELCRRYNSNNLNSTHTGRGIIERFIANSNATTQYFNLVKKAFERMLYHFSKTTFFREEIVRNHLNFLCERTITVYCGVTFFSAILVVYDEIYSMEGDLITEAISKLRYLVLEGINARIIQDKIDAYRRANEEGNPEGFHMHTLGVLARYANINRLNIPYVDSRFADNDDIESVIAKRFPNLPLALDTNFFAQFTYRAIVEAVSESFAAEILSHSGKDFSNGDNLNDLLKVLDPLVKHQIISPGFLHNLLDEETYTLDTEKIRYLVDAKTGKKITPQINTAGVEVKTEVHPKIKEWCERLLIAEGYFIKKNPGWNDIAHSLYITTTTAINLRKTGQNLIRYLLSNAPKKLPAVLLNWDVKNTFSMLFQPDQNNSTPIDTLRSYPQDNENIIYVKKWLSQNIDLELIRYSSRFSKELQEALIKTVLQNDYISSSAFFAFRWWESDNKSDLSKNLGEIISLLLAQHNLQDCNTPGLKKIVETFMRFSLFNQIDEEKFLHKSNLSSLKRIMVGRYASFVQNGIPEIDKCFALLWSLHKQRTPSFLPGVLKALSDFFSNPDNKTEFNTDGAQEIYAVCLDFVLTPDSNETQLATSLTKVLSEREIRISGKLRSLGLEPNKPTNKLHVALRHSLQVYYEEAASLGTETPTSFVQYRNTWRVHPDDNVWMLLFERIQYIKSVNAGYGEKLETWLGNFCAIATNTVGSPVKECANTLPKPTLLTTWWSNQQYRDLTRLANMCVNKTMDEQTALAYRAIKAHPVANGSGARLASH